jgi:hypothetical protein
MVSGAAPHRFLVSRELLVLICLLLPLDLVFLLMNRSKTLCLSIPMMRVSVQMDVCGRNVTYWCSGKRFTVCTTEEERAEIFDAVFDAAIKVGINVQQYQWFQDNLTSTAHGPIRRQGTSQQMSWNSSPKDGYEM